ncbi:response regulator [Actinoplanes sp. NPDC049118]|uniref:response regulator n=1 Tax=Actinoplanes sp. NPDC049118 TaxID=3155769 RepID=UPI0033D65D9C
MGAAVQVLLVDDDQADIALIMEAFDAHRVPSRVHVAHDGIEALGFLRAGDGSRGSRPDMILLDLNMPRMDGREVLAEIKRDPALATIPVVVFTTSDQPEDIACSYARHANAYVTKPLDLDAFARAVDSIHDFYGDLVQRPAPRPA